MKTSFTGDELSSSALPSWAQWIRPIPGHAGYLADLFGNIWTLKGPRARKLKPSRDKDNYLKVGLMSDAAAQTRKVHRVVLLAWRGPCPDGMEACHGNGIRHDNRVLNLRWDTKQANTADRVRHQADRQAIHQVRHQADRQAHLKRPKVQLRLFAS